MRLSRLRRAGTIAVVLTALVRAAAVGAQSPAPVLEIDDVTIVPGTISMSAIVRISVRNRSDIERRVCLGGFHVAMRPVGDSYAEGRALECQHEGPFITIPPDGVHIVERSILRRNDMTGRLQIWMLLFHAAADTNDAPVPLDSAWEGSVEEALR